MTSVITVPQNLITVDEPETHPPTFFPMPVFSLFLSILSHIFTLSAIRPTASLRRLWTYYYPRGASGEEAPGSALSFVVAGLLSFAEIKSQGQAEFPFQSHPRATLVTITSLIIYGLASGAEQVIFTAPAGPTSVFAIIARWGKMGCLCIFVASLASLFYF